MEKLAYLLWNDGTEVSADGFRDRLLAALPERLALDDALEAGDQDLSKLFGALETEINKHSSDLRKFAGL